MISVSLVVLMLMKYDECVFAIRIMNLDYSIYKYAHIFVYHLFK